MNPLPNIPPTSKTTVTVTLNTPNWQPDEQALSCLSCNRRFGFFLRKHHCRRCGYIFCDTCCAKYYIPAKDLTERICTRCLSEPSEASDSRTSRQLIRGSDNSIHSDMSNCPVCSKNLYGLHEDLVEQHVAKCIESTSTTSTTNHRYLLQTLDHDLGLECPICFENLGKGTLTNQGASIARLYCLCVFHETCIKNWYSHPSGRACCPIHSD